MLFEVCQLHVIRKQGPTFALQSMWYAQGTLGWSSIYAQKHCSELLLVPVCPQI